MSPTRAVVQRKCKDWYLNFGAQSSETTSKEFRFASHAKTSSSCGKHWKCRRFSIQSIHKATLEGHLRRCADRAKWIYRPSCTSILRLRQAERIFQTQKCTSSRHQWVYWEERSPKATITVWVERAASPNDYGEGTCLWKDQDQILPKPDNVLSAWVTGHHRSDKRDYGRVNLGQNTSTPSSSFKDQSRRKGQRPTGRLVGWRV